MPDLDRTIPEKPDGPVLLMSHGPDYADEVLAHPRGRLVDLMLAGHSHGGQVRLPLIGALHTPTGRAKYVEGLFRFGRMQLYVNRGIGTVALPFRLNCPPEITLFTLHGRDYLSWPRATFNSKSARHQPALPRSALPASSAAASRPHSPAPWGCSSSPSTHPAGSA